MHNPSCRVRVRGTAYVIPGGRFQDWQVYPAGRKASQVLMAIIAVSCSLSASPLVGLTGHCTMLTTVAGPKH
jgi:hypothetical protein